MLRSSSAGPAPGYGFGPTPHVNSHSNRSNAVGPWTYLTAALMMGWLAVGAFEWVLNSAYASLVGQPAGWDAAGYVEFWGITALLVPGLTWVLRRVPVGRGRIGRAVTWTGVVSLLYLLAHVVLRYLWASWARFGSLPDPLDYLRTTGSFVALHVTGAVFCALVNVAAVGGVSFYLRLRERNREATALELERARLRASLSEARLEVLQAQLQPHFLFNALHALSTLILKGDTRSANEMLSHVSRFLRITLDSADTPAVPLAVELEFLDAYLSIQRVRFGDRLHVAVVVDEPARSLAVPSLVLQPLVENSIRHGIAADSGRGHISIRAYAADGTLTLEVEDDGRGLPGGRVPPEGTGLANIRQRLAELYPDAHVFTLLEGAAGGALARITIPARVLAGDQEVSPRG